MKKLVIITLFILVLSACSKNTKPDRAFNPYPAANATDVTDSVLKWEAFDIDGDLLNYDIVIMKIIEERRTELVVFEHKHEVDSIVFNKIENNTHYVWSVTVKDGKKSRLGSSWGFTTGTVH